MEIEFILYVADQNCSRNFYAAILGLDPVLDVPGMTAFQISDSTRIGLMPENGIAKIITPALPHPKDGNGIPRCELYLRMKDAESKFNNAILKGGMLVDDFRDRDWGDRAGYFADPDGHVIAFAQKS